MVAAKAREPKQERKKGRWDQLVLEYTSSGENTGREEPETYQKNYLNTTVAWFYPLWFGNTIWGLVDNRGNSIIGNTTRRPDWPTLLIILDFIRGSKFSSIISIAGSSVLSTILKIMRNYLSTIIWRLHRVKQTTWMVFSWLHDKNQRSGQIFFNVAIIYFSIPIIIPN